MSKRGSVFAITFGLIVSASSALPQTVVENEPREEKDASESQDTGTNQQGRPIIPTSALEGIESAIRDLMAEEDKIERARQQQREIRDLSAQEGMALWAKRMFLATFATVLLTFAALAAIIRTLHHTRRAAGYTRDILVEAKKTTSLAMDTINVTESVAMAQLRPWLLGKGVESSDVVDTSGGESISALEFAPVWYNFGQSPAINVGLWCHYLLVPRDSEVPKFTSAEVSSNTTIGPQDRTMGKYNVITGQDFADVVAGTKEIMIFIRCDYDDSILHHWGKPRVRTHKQPVMPKTTFPYSGR